MKKINPKVTKVVTGTVSVSILAASCNVSDYNFDDNSLYEITPNTGIGVQLCDINESNLSEDFIKKLNSIKIFVESIMLDNTIIDKYGDNPDEYFDLIENKLGVTFTYDERVVLKAYFDKDIQEAIKNQDLDDFLRIAKERGYLGVIKNKTPEDLRALFKSDEEFEGFMETMNSIGDDAIFPVVAVFVLAVFAVAITTAAAEIQIAAHLGYVAWTAAVVPGEVIRPIEPIAPIVEPVIGIAEPIGGIVSPLNSAVPASDAGNQKSKTITPEFISAQLKEPVLKLWTDNNGLIANDIFYREIIDEQVEILTKIIVKHFPQYEESAVREVLRVNLEGYYGLRK